MRIANLVVDIGDNFLKFLKDIPSPLGKSPRQCAVTILTPTTAKNEHLTSGFSFWLRGQKSTFQSLVCPPCSRCSHLPLFPTMPSRHLFYHVWQPSSWHCSHPGEWVNKSKFWILSSHQHYPIHRVNVRPMLQQCCHHIHITFRSCQYQHFAAILTSNHD